jgi:hypothetical protein
MKLRLFLSLATALALPALAQDSAPAEKTASPAPEPAAPAETSLLDPLPSDPSPIDAATLPPAPEMGISPPTLKAKPPKSDDAALEEERARDELQIGTIEDRIKFRRARTKALGDAKIIAAADRAAQATTDPEKRAALAEYYGMLFAQVRKTEPGLEATIAAAEEQISRRLDPVTAQEKDKKAQFERKQAKKAAAAAKASPAPSPAKP